MEALLEPGWGQGTFQDVAELRKALQTGYEVTIPSIAGGQALTVQSLDKTLKTITYTDRHLKFFKLLQPSDATALVDEWVERAGYGGEYGGFVGEMENPEDVDTELARRVGYVKFVRAIGKVSHPMSVVRNIVDAMAMEAQSKTRWMLGVIERALFNGDGSIIPEQFDGIFTLIEKNVPENIVDLRGKRIINLPTGTKETFFDEWAGYIVDAPNYGTPTHFIANPLVFKDIASVFAGERRIVLNINAQGQGQNIVEGFGLRGYRSLYGYFDFVDDVFIKKAWPAPSQATNSKAPNAPTASGAAEAGPFGDSKWSADDLSGHQPGDYWYYVTAVNKWGESAPVRVPSTGTITVAAGGRITLTITAAGDGEPATGFRIYRTIQGGDTPTFIKQVAKAQSGDTTVYDYNEDLPTTTKAVLLDIEPGETLDWRQLLPLIKIDVPFGVFGPVRAWYQMLYGYLRLIAPRKQLLIKNVGLPPIALTKTY